MKLSKIIFLSACIGLGINFHAWTMEKNQVEQEKKLVDQTGWNDLHKAAYAGDLDAIKTAIASGIAVDAFIDYPGGEFDGYTAQHLAAINGKTDAIRLLVTKFGDMANTPIRKPEILWHGLTTLHLATGYQQMDVIRLLITELGVNADTPIYNPGGDLHGYTALHLASSAGYINIIRLLIKLGANVSMPVNAPRQSSDGHTALHLAAINRQKDVIRLLVKEYNVDVKSKIYAPEHDYNEWTLMDLAVYHGYTDVILQLATEFGVTNCNKAREIPKSKKIQ